MKYVPHLALLAALVAALLTDHLSTEQFIGLLIAGGFLAAAPSVLPKKD